MRILFNSRDLQFKDPFGTLLPGQTCTLRIQIPESVCPQAVECVFVWDDYSPAFSVFLTPDRKVGLYEQFSGSFAIAEPGLYFYYFRITTPNNCFHLFKQGDDTNMEAGDLWQVTCIPPDFVTPEWARGATIYQVFPDRFYKSGDCDLTGKLEPYTVHEHWDEEVQWRPDHHGVVLNNDFYGGNFRGIAEKMDYIASLGVTILYLNPIGKSFSNHRYDTGDYKTPDPMLGTMADFSALCDAAHARGIKVILDGVYAHTGSDSLYFNKYGHFPGIGAYQSKQSPFHSWYTFYHFPHQYNAWWNFDTLPTVKKLDPAFMEYIITGKDSVIAHWLNAGCDGFRLDVADELPNAFMVTLKQHLRKLRPDALLLGEVWEDASSKISYGIRTRYFTDGTLDSVMNYPFRTAILNFLRDRDDGSGLMETVMTIAENYPPEVLLCNMNMLGTHDTPRILTNLIGDYEGDRAKLAGVKLNHSQLLTALRRLRLASVLQYTLPGSPSLYYGDEAQMEGCKDPFNRRTYPWGRENPDLLSHFRVLGQLRKDHPALRLGNIRFLHAAEQKVAFIRSYREQTIRVCVNRSGENWDIPAGKLLYGHNLRNVAPDWLTLAPMGFCILED